MAFFPGKRSPAASHKQPEKLNRMKHLLILLFSLYIYTGCTRPDKEKPYVIGISQCMLDDAWRQAMIREVGIEASNYDHIRVIVKDANSTNERQIEQIRELIARKVDVLIISPFESAPLTAVAEEAYRAGIPTIITDRKVDTEQYTTFVGADNYEIGLSAGRYAAGRLPANAAILEIWGMAGSSPAQERHNGFRDALKSRTDLTFRRIEGNWRYDTAAEQLKTLAADEPVDFVFAHNDMMAIAAREHFLAVDSVHDRQLPVIGMDAVAGAGLEAIADGRIDASFLYPTGGEQVIRTAVQLIRGEEVPHYIPLSSGVVDRAAARTLLLDRKSVV